MRTKLSWVMGSIFVAALAIAGCSSDDDNNDGTQNTGGSGGEGGSGGSGGSGGGSGEGACTNDSDRAASRAGYCPDNRSVSSIVSACAKECLTGGDDCTRECVDEGTNSALSAECRDCYIELTACGAKNCLQHCLSDPTSADCLVCLCGDNAKQINCYEAFNECTGLGVTYCEDVANGTFEGYPEPEPPAQCDETDGGTDGGDEPDGGDEDPDAGEDPDSGDEDPDAGDEEDAG